MELKAELKYTKSHEWIAKDGDVATIGLTDYAQSELGDLVFVNLPEEGDEVTVGEAFGDVESVKAASDVYSPVTGLSLIHICGNVHATRIRIADRIHV